MARSLFIAFIATILVLSFLLVNFKTKVNTLTKQVKEQSTEIDSLTNEVQSLDMTAGRLQFIVDQVQDLHNKKIDEIIKNTE